MKDTNNLLRNARAKFSGAELETAQEREDRFEAVEFVDYYFQIVSNWDMDEYAKRTFWGADFEDCFESMILAYAAIKRKDHEVNHDALRWVFVEQDIIWGGSYSTRHIIAHYHQVY